MISKVTKLLILILAVFSGAAHSCLYEFADETVESSIMLNQAAFSGHKVLDIALDKNGQPVFCYYDNRGIFVQELDGQTDLIYNNSMVADTFNFCVSRWGDHAAAFGYDGLYYKQSWQQHGNIYNLDQVPGQIYDVVFSGQDIPHLLTEDSGCVYYCRYDVQTNKWDIQLIADYAHPLAISISENGTIVVLAYNLGIQKKCLYTTNGINWYGHSLPDQCQNAMQYELDIRFDGTPGIVCWSGSEDIYYCQFLMMFGSWHLENVVRSDSISSDRLAFCFKPDGRPAIVYPVSYGDDNKLILTERHPDGRWCSTITAVVPYENKIYSPSFVYNNSDTVLIAYMVGSDDHNSGSLHLQKGIWNPADYNRNSIVDMNDFTFIANNWQKNGPVTQSYDLTYDNEIDISDLAEFVECWLAGRQFFLDK